MSRRHATTRGAISFDLRSISARRAATEPCASSATGAIKAMSDTERKRFIEVCGWVTDSLNADNSLNSDFKGRHWTGGAQLCGLMRIALRCFTLVLLSLAASAARGQSAALVGSVF